MPSEYKQAETIAVYASDENEMGSESTLHHTTIFLGQYIYHNRQDSSAQDSSGTTSKKLLINHVSPPITGWKWWANNHEILILSWHPL